MNTFFMLVRREYWEHRGLIWTPVIIVAVLLVLHLAFLMFGLRQPAMGELPGVFKNVLGAFANGLFADKLAHLPGILCAIAYLFVGLSYALDCLFAERRDRSVLFWRSLPVSDTQTVLAKLFTVIVATALVVFVAGIVGHAGSVGLTMLVNSFSGSGVESDFGSFSGLLSTWLTWAYVLLTMIIWFVPVVSWFIFVSSWASRAGFLAATVPVMLLTFGESIVFGTRHLGNIVWGRVFFYDYAQVSFTQGQADPGKFFSSMSVWAGLLVSAIFIALAIYFRRYREDV